MSKNIFADTAPNYWKAGMPVIPLRSMAKVPVPLGWQNFHDSMPDEQTRTNWLKQYPNGNIGLPLGKQSRVIALDIDTTDESLIRLIEEALPKSPWIRYGKKGKVLAYAYSGQKTFRIKAATGETICELLSEKTQVVLPASIHPETKLPYTANCDLFTVVDSLPKLQPDIEEKLRAVISNYGIVLSRSGHSKLTEYVSSGSRDTNLTEKAGLFAMAVMRGERTLLEALGMLQSYANEFIQNVVGDSMDIEKHKRNLIRFLTRDVMEKKKILPEGWDTGLSDEEKKNLNINFDRDTEEWRCIEIVDFLKEVFTQDEGLGTTISMEATDKILRKMAHSKNLNRMEVDRILSLIVKESGLGVKIGTLNKQINETRKEDGMAGANHSEIAEAVLQDMEVLFDFAFDKGDFWKFNGSHWETIRDAWLIRHISQNYGTYDAARRNGDLKGILELMQSLSPQEIKKSHLQGVNFVNGFLTDKLELLPHKPEYGMMYTLPFRYIASAGGVNLHHDAPLFSDFLETCWGGDSDFMEKVQALQEALLVTLFGWGSKFQKVILLQGVAKSGKSQLLSIASALVSDEARSAVSPNAWGDPYSPAHMVGKLLNIAGELSEEKRIDGQKFKEIMDGSEITCRKPYGDPFRAQITATHWFGSNPLPKTKDSSEGFNRRWLILTFNRPVPDSKIELDIAGKIILQEREMITAWAIQAMPRVLAQQGYTLPRSHTKIMEEMACINNIVRAFVKNSNELSFTPNAQIPEKRVYEIFWSWALTHGSVKMMNIGEFRLRMRELSLSMGFEIEMNEATGAAVYHGVGLPVKKGGSV
jgi:P4 family phage/plasmid primase-like protien